MTKTLLHITAAIAIIASVSFSVSFLTPYSVGRSSCGRSILFQKIANARDLGGYPTKQGAKVRRGVLLKTGELSYATKKDQRKLKRIGVDTIIDLRGARDIKYAPDVKIKGVRYVNHPAKYHGSSSIRKILARYRTLKRTRVRSFKYYALLRAERVRDSYTESLLMSSYSKKAYKNYFKTLLGMKKGGTVLVHCVHGKDRAGIAAFLTLAALGVKERDALREYGMTNVYYKKYAGRAYRARGLGVSVDSLRRAVRKVKRKYGSIRKFLNKAYGMSDKKIEKLRKLYTV